MRFVFIIIIVILNVINCQDRHVYWNSFYEGECPEYDNRLINTVNFEMLDGRWYEYARFGYLSRCKCVYADYKHVNNETFLMFYRGQQYHDRLIAEKRPFPWVYSNGTAIVGEDNLTQKLKMNFTVETSSLFMSIMPNPVLLIAFHYDSYLLFWACTQKSRHRSEYALIYTRKPVLDELNERDKTLIYRLGVEMGHYSMNISELNYVKQDDCNY